MSTVCLRALLAAMLLSGCSELFPYAPAASDLARVDADDVGAGDVDGGDASGGDLAEMGLPDGLACDQQQLTLESEEDDGEIYDSTVNGLLFRPDGEYDAWYPDAIYIGYGSGSAQGYFRFKLQAPIAANTVKTATLSLWGKSRCTSVDCCSASDCVADRWDEVKPRALVISLEKSADASLVEDEFDRPESQQRTLISESVTWPEQGDLDWRLGEHNRSPNLAALINSLATQHELEKGVHLQFWVKGAFNNGTARVGTSAFGQPDYVSPQLDLIWCD